MFFKGLIFLVLFWAFLAPTAATTETALDTYVWTPDPHYSWFDTGERLEGYSLDKSHHWTGYILNMTSQQWLTPEDVTRSIWTHVIVVIVPDNVEFTRNASMWITGWNNCNDVCSYPTAKDEDIALAAALAMGTGTICGALFQIPNEKVVFSGDPKQQQRGEDAIIAYTWDHFLKHPDQPEWLVRFPMVKASLRAMDTITAFVSQMNIGCQLDYYVVSGASKRGWTTWLVGAVDPARVVGIVPIVLDAVNFVTVMHHQWKSYGGWSFALSDYYEMNITARLDDPNMLKLQEVEDPYWYFDRLTMPKLVINAVGDEFQQPDDWLYWMKDLPEPKRFLMIPNAEHSLATGILEAVPVIGTWTRHLLTSKPVPNFKWTISNTTGDVSVTLDPRVGDALHVNLWYSYSCPAIPRRDFRFLTADNPCKPCGPYVQGTCLNLKVFWHQTRLSPEKKGGFQYTGHIDPPTEKGQWVASFIDITYKEDGDDSLGRPEGGFPFTKPGHLEFTTPVSIWPQEFPFEDCYGADCYGTLL